jgi:hypothetical protein
MSSGNGLTIDFNLDESPQNLLSSLAEVLNDNLRLQFGRNDMTSALFRALGEPKLQTMVAGSSALVAQSVENGWDVVSYTEGKPGDVLLNLRLVGETVLQFRLLHAARQMPD